MKLIEIIRNFKDDGQQFFKGEARMVTPEKAGYYCGNGWAKDADKENPIPTGERDLTPKKLEVHSAIHRSAASHSGG